MDMAPGTIVDSMIGPGMTEEDLIKLYEQYDLDKPMVYRYAKYMIHLVQGDLGVSLVNNRSVWNEFISRLPNTLLLAFTSLIIGAAVSVPLGVRAARRAGTLSDNAMTVFTLIGISLPLFWLGLLLLLLFSATLRWFPAGGMTKGIRSLILPALCGSLGLMANIARQTRSNMLEVLNADYLRTARAKGVPEKTIISKHALGNAWIPIITAIGTSLAAQLAGSVVVESVFAWPGIGRMAADAVLTRDTTTILGCVIMTTILYVLVQLGVDLVYAFVDPRIKAQYTTASRKKKNNRQYDNTGAGSERAA